MAGLVVVEGAEKIKLVAIALRKMGTDRTIVNEMTKRIRKLGPVARKEIGASARSSLPHTGGLGEWVARARVRVSVRRSARNAGVSIVVGRDSLTGRSDIKAIDAGRVRHPVFGNRKHWSLESVTPGFATRPVQGPVFDEFRDEVSQAIDDAVAKVVDF